MTNTWSLGTHSGYDGMSEIFSGGDFCDPRGDYRSARITYTFGDSTEILSFSEPTTCFYEFHIQIECIGNFTSLNLIFCEKRKYLNEDDQVEYKSTTEQIK